MTKLRAGAPFDSNNLFNIPPLDPGPIVVIYPTALVARVDCGTFIEPKDGGYDGGVIPPAGTATYDPTYTYGPNDIITD